MTKKWPNLLCATLKKRLKKSNFTFQIETQDAGQRIDKVLGSHPDVGSRSKAEALIRQGLVTLRNKAVKVSHKVSVGDQYQVQIPEAEASGLVPLKMDLEILFEDDHIIVLNKPAGLVVHPAAGHAQDTLVNALMGLDTRFSMQFGEDRPGIVHRLDKDTSGLLVVAKTSAAQEALVSQFKARTVHRRYQAIVQAKALPLSGSIQSYLGRHPVDRKRFSSIKDSSGKILRDENLEVAHGKWAKTHFKINNRRPSGLSLVILKLETGRTHQIRVHLSEAGAAILADPIYLRNSSMAGCSSLEKQLIDSIPRLCLHAFELGFQHPATSEQMRFIQDWPEDLRDILKSLDLWKAPHGL